MEDIKKFEDFLDRMQGILDNAKKQGHIIVRVEDLENAFPELKEREDEITWLTKYIEEEASSLSMDIRGNEDLIKLKKLQRSLAWLEKQGEQTSLQTNERAWLYLVSDVLTWKDGIGQYLDDPRVQELAKELCSEYAQKLYNPSVFPNSSNTERNEQRPANKVEPKFKVGDWIVFANGNVERITGVGTHGYMFDDDDYLLHENCDKQARLWNIKDAKDGDVIFVKPTENLGKQLIIFGGIDSNGRIKYYCRFLNNKFSIGGGLMGYDHKYFLPATKEQCDALEKAMADARYTFDFDKKELKKIEQSPIDVRTTGYWHVEDVEQTPAWSEEDKNRFNNLIFLVECSKENGATKEGFISFINKLKSLRPQNTWKPSDEQMKALDDALSLAKSCGEESAFDLSTLQDDLKRLLKI